MNENFSVVPAPPEFDPRKRVNIITPGWAQALKSIPSDLSKRVEAARKLEELRASWWKKCFKEASRLDHMALVFEHDFCGKYPPRYLQRGVTLRIEVRACTVRMLCVCLRVGLVGESSSGLPWGT